MSSTNYQLNRFVANLIKCHVLLNKAISECDNMSDFVAEKILLTPNIFLLMMKSWFLAASVLLISSMQVLAQEFESATSAVNNMRVGWNLGNTLDANSGSTTNMWIEKWSQRKTSS